MENNTKTYFLFLLLVLNSISIFSQNTSIEGDKIVLKTSTGDITGTIRVPETNRPIPVVLIIAGSGPTDRNGNQPQMQNNSLKLLAESLYQSSIASVSYDKRAIAESRMLNLDESKLTLDTYIRDANDWVELINKDPRFSAIVVLGHSEGSLIGMLVASMNKNVDKFVSIAGPGRNMSDILEEQLKKSLTSEKYNIVSSYIEKLKRGESIDTVSSDLYTLFRPSVQPFLISYFKYDPTQIIAKVDIPILIIQGSTDIQVTVEDAHLLSKANNLAVTKLILNMNHVLKDCTLLDQQSQIATYINPNLPLNTELMPIIVQFINY